MTNSEECRVYSGFWYIPSADESKIQKFSGILQVSRSGRITLEFTLEPEILEAVIPGFGQILLHINNQIPIPVIVGYAKDLESKNDISFTLTDLELAHYSRSGLIHAKLEAKHAITLFQATTREALKFQSSMMKFEGMDDWLDLNGFEINVHSESKKYKTTVEFTQPDPIDIMKNENEQIYFYFRASAPTLPNTNEIVINQSIFINWEHNEMKSIDELVTFSDRLQNFFSFISSYPSRRSRHEVRFLKGKIDPENYSRYIDREFFYKERAADFTDQIKQRDFLFTYSTFKERSKDILANWILLYSDYTMIFDQYFDMKYNKNLHISSRLITTTSILEILYVRMHKTDPRNLTLKLNNLINGKIEVFKTLPVSKDNMIEQIVAIRKYFVHGNRSEHFAEENTTDKSLFRFTLQLENIFKVYILSKLGLSDEEISTLIKRQPWKWGMSL